MQKERSVEGEIEREERGKRREREREERVESRCRVEWQADSGRGRQRHTVEVEERGADEAAGGERDRLLGHAEALVQHLGGRVEHSGHSAQLSPVPGTPRDPAHQPAAHTTHPYRHS